jgi:hypothetical protein
MAANVASISTIKGKVSLMSTVYCTIIRYVNVSDTEYILVVTEH